MLTSKQWYNGVSKTTIEEEYASNFAGIDYHIEYSLVNIIDERVKPWLKPNESSPIHWKTSKPYLVEMKQAGEENAMMEWLQSMPGTGLIMSSIIATEIDDVSRFSDSSRL